MKISDQFCFDLKTSIPVSNSTHYIYLTHNLIKTIWHNCPSSWKMTYQLKILLSSNPLYWWKRDTVKVSCRNIKHWTRGTGSSDSEILPQRWPNLPYFKPFYRFTPVLLLQYVYRNSCAYAYFLQFVTPLGQKYSKTSRFRWTRGIQVNLWTVIHHTFHVRPFKLGIYELLLSPS